jgi:hypothetical protein
MRGQFKDAGAEEEMAAIERAPNFFWQYFAMKGI